MVILRGSHWREGGADDLFGRELKEAGLRNCSEVGIAEYLPHQHVSQSLPQFVDIKMSGHSATKFNLAQSELI